MSIKKHSTLFILTVICSFNSFSQLLFEGKIIGEIFYRNAPNSITQIISYYKGNSSRFEIEMKDSLGSSVFKPNFIIINDYLKGERLILSEKLNNTAVIFDLPLIDDNIQHTEKISEYVMFAKYDCQKTILTYTLSKNKKQEQSIIYVNNNFSVNRSNGMVDSTKYTKLPLSIDSYSTENGNHTYRATSILENTLNSNLFNTINTDGYTLLDVRKEQRACANENTTIDTIISDKYSVYSMNELQDLKKSAATKEDFDTAAEIKDVIEKRKLIESKDGKYSKLFLSELHQLLNTCISNNDYVYAHDLTNEIIKRFKMK